MYGVVLWSDPDGGQAVIWCEDCGNLAFYQAPDSPDHLRNGFFDAGDYVEFEVTKDDRLRRASNAHKVRPAEPSRVQETIQQGLRSEPGRRHARPGSTWMGSAEPQAGAALRGTDISRLG